MSSGLTFERKNMELEKQVCSLELAEKLKELGVKQESHFKWHFPLRTQEAEQYGYDDREFEPKIFTEDEWDAYATDYDPPPGIMYSAFTVAELGEMLPPHFVCVRTDFATYRCWSESNTVKADAQDADTEANARAKMLIYLLENNLLKQ